MSIVYTAEEIIESIRNLGMVPDAGTLGSEDADILLHVNEEMALTMIPDILATREEYLVVTTRQTLTSNVLKYRMPNRAIGEKLRFIRYVDSAGSKSPLEEIGPVHHDEYSWDTTSTPIGYYLEGNYICLIGSGFSGSLELSWYFRPGQLVLSTQCRKITNVSTKTLTLSGNVPASWSTLNKFDIHSGESGAEIKVWGELASAVGGSGVENRVIMVNSIDGTTFGTHPVEVGDWLCLEKECAILPLPIDLQPLLVRAVQVRLAEAQGDAQTIKIEHDLLAEAKKNTSDLYSERAGRPYRIKACRGILWRM